MLLVLHYFELLYLFFLSFQQKLEQVVAKYALGFPPALGLSLVSQLVDIFESIVSEILSEVRVDEQDFSHVHDADALRRLVSDVVSMFALYVDLQFVFELLPLLLLMVAAFITSTLASGLIYFEHEK